MTKDESSLLLNIICPAKSVPIKSCWSAYLWGDGYTVKIYIFFCARLASLFRLQVVNLMTMNFSWSQLCVLPFLPNVKRSICLARRILWSKICQLNLPAQKTNPKRDRVSLAQNEGILNFVKKKDVKLFKFWLATTSQSKPNVAALLNWSISKNMHGNNEIEINTYKILASGECGTLSCK